MEDILSTVFVLIPVAIFIALRMLNANKKKAEAEERKKLAEALARAAAYKKPPESEFDAHSLVPDDEEDEDAAPPPKPVRIPARPAHSLLGASMAVGPLAVTSESPAPAAAASAASAHEAPAYGAHAATKTAHPEAAASSSVFARVERMSPLKRAVVYAELLGPPKF